MPIYNGNKKIDSLYFNGKKIASAFFGNKQVYSSGIKYECSITNLGAENPNDVVFAKSDNFPTESQAWEEVTIGNDKFAKFTPWYKKVVADENGNVREIHLANYKKNNDYYIYDCFLDESGNELPYILIGEYCISSTTTANSVDAAAVNINIGNARTLARAKGTGYQLIDCSMYMFWRDLALAVSEKINFNAGAGVPSYMGLKRMQEGWWLDGIASDTGNILYCSKPSKYVNQPTSSSDGYVTLSYQNAKSNGCIKELGYDSTNPNINLSKETSGTDYAKYYCDGYFYASGNHVTGVDIGKTSPTNPYRGLFTMFNNDAWSVTYGNRLAYRPIQGGNQ